MSNLFYVLIHAPILP